MRVADAVFRQGHLSEQALVDALLGGNRPAHLDRCDLCAERAVELGRWLDHVRSMALEAADEAFPPERLSIQHTQIMRRLEQMDHPTRVIAFPSQYRIESPATHARRVSPAWVGIAAAAGLALGVVGGHLTARLGEPEGSAVAQRVPVEQPAATQPGPSIFDFDLENTSLRGTPAGVLDEMTPRAIDTLVSNRVGG